MAAVFKSAISARLNGDKSRIAARGKPSGRAECLLFQLAAFGWGEAGVGGWLSAIFTVANCTFHNEGIPFRPIYERTICGNLDDKKATSFIYYSTEALKSFPHPYHSLDLHGDSTMVSMQRVTYNAICVQGFKTLRPNSVTVAGTMPR